MTKRVKMSDDFYFRNKDNKKKIRKNKLKKVSSIFTKIPKFFAYHFKYNKANFIAICSFTVLFLAVIIPAVISTFAKQGYNQNVVNGDDGISDYDVFYDNLKTVTQKEYSYVAYDASSTPSGDGTQANPWIISNGHDLDVIATNVYDGRTNWDSTDVYITLNADIDLTGAESSISGLDSGTNLKPIIQKNNYFSIYFNGNYHHIKGLKPMIKTDNGSEYQGLFGILRKNSVVKNLILDDIDVSVYKNTTGNLYSGAIAGKLEDNAKIYNCGITSGNVSVSFNNSNNASVGTMVGEIKGSSVVTNSYSAANMSNTQIHSGVIYGGIVGYRNVNNGFDEQPLSKSSAVAYLLAYYGKMSIINDKNRGDTGRGTYQFVYNGNKIPTNKTNSYCYYLWRGDSIDSSSDTSNDSTYNTYAIAKSYDEMTNDGFKTHLNGYRYMVNYYLGFDQNIDQSSDKRYTEIGYWYTSNSEKMNSLILPKLKVYEEISNDKYKQFYEVSSGSTCPSGYLKVTIINTTKDSESVSLCSKITGKNPENEDYVNNKIVLPFNSKLSTPFTFYNNTSGFDRIITGWKLSDVKYNGTSTSAGTKGSYINYDYTLRTGLEGATKDIDTVYAQGGYYLVPDGVSEVVFKTQWAYAIYVGDQYGDSVMNNHQVKDNNVSQTYYGSKSFSIGDGKSKNSPTNSIKTAYETAKGIGANGLNMYEVAFVLVNNIHVDLKYNGWADYDAFYTNTDSNWPITDSTNEVTIMSVDNDGNLSPDYSVYMGGPKNTLMYGIRFDFVNVLENPQVGTINSGLNNFTVSTSTNMAFKKQASFETTETVVTDKVTVRTQSATSVKINGGYVNIENRWDAEKDSADDGNDNKASNIYFGGTALAEFVNFGEEDTSSANFSHRMPVFNITGGRIKLLSSTYLNAGIDSSSRVYFNVDGGYIGDFYTTYNGSLLKDAVVNIKGAYINNYYAGGHTSTSKVVGGVNTTITDSVIDYVYGGPEYGTITNYSTLNIYNSTINYLFGGGYGGTQVTAADTQTKQDSYYSIDVNSNYRLGTTSTYGILTNFNALIYTKQISIYSAYTNYYSELSIASVDRVFINLKKSTINKELYGGGNKGAVSKSVVINMEDSVVGKSGSKSANVYGAGKTNANESTDVCVSSGGNTPSFVSFFIDNEVNCPSDQVQKYTWSDEDTFDDGERIDTYRKLLQSNNVSKLGIVTGDIIMNISNSKIYGNIYGGGNLSKVKDGDIHINLYNDTLVTGSVYGGGNEASVEGDTDVRIKGGTYGNVFAGGNNGQVSGEATATISQDSKITEGAYGGGNNTSADSTKLYLVDGTIANAYGGSNSSGIIGESHVYISALNPSTEKYTLTIPDGEKQEVEPDSKFVSTAGSLTGHQNLSTSGKCDQRDLEFNYTELSKPSWGNLYYTTLTITNPNSYDITVNSARILVGNSQVNPHINHNQYFMFEGTSFKGVDSEGNTVSYAYLTLRQTFTIPANSTFTDSLEMIYADSEDLKLWFESIEITSTGGRIYCYEERASASDDDDDSSLIITDDRFNFTLPTNDTEVGTVKVTNLFGGNNQGGKTVEAYVHITGENAFVENVFGGGNLAETTNTHVEIINANGVENIFGGGNGITEYDELGNSLEPTELKGTVTGETNVNIVNSQIYKNIYAGGNGRSAVTLGDTHVTISGASTYIDGSVFGGGNASDSGSSTKLSNAYVHIAAGTITKDVYGGPNTAKVKGTTYVDIGYTSDDLETGDISIGGTVFGGGRANVNDSGKYDYTFESVTKGTNVYIEPRGHDITLTGSVYGSGNNSTIAGDSIVKLVNFGTESTPKIMESIQRATYVLLDNSSVYLRGYIDSANQYDNITYSISRVDDFVLANNSNLYAKDNANLLKKFESKLIGTDVDEYEKVTIDSETGEVTKNVDNKIFLESDTTFNILQTQQFTNGIFGEVKGMTYFGLFSKGKNNELRKGIYSDTYKNGDTATVNDALFFASGSLINGLKVDDVETDGFYSHFVDSDNDYKLSVDFIRPENTEETYYTWIIGEKSEVVKIDLKASTFSKDATAELQLMDYSKPSTYFEILGFSTGGLDPMVNIVSSEKIPRVADTEDEANYTFGLSMKQSISGWKTNGRTDFIAEGDNTYYTGTSKYETNDTNEVPILNFYLTNSKNITLEQDLGYALIAVRVYVPKDEVSFTTAKLTVKVNISTLLRDGDSYEATMTPGKEYDLFSDEITYITSDSSLTASYSLYATLKDTKKNPITAFETGSYRTLVSSYMLPENTHITMIDKTDYSNPVYYYYTVTAADNATVPTSVERRYVGLNSTYYHYPISKFVRMGSNSSDNHFDDDRANKEYYDSSTGVSSELMLFIVDFSDATFTSDMLDQELLYELKDSDGDTRITVDAKQYVQHSIINTNESAISVDLTPDRTAAYVGSEMYIFANLDLTQASYGDSKITVYDTNYIQDKMGLKISIYDSNGNIVDGPGLVGTLFYVDDVSYSANYDGTIRMKVSDLVTKIKSNIRIDLTKSKLSTGTYRVVAEAFGSPDGLYYGLTSSGVGETTIQIYNDSYGLNVESDENDVILDSSSGLNLNKVNESTFKIKYSTRLKRVNLRFKLSRRKYDETYSMEYEDVGSGELFSDSFNVTGENEYEITSIPTEDIVYSSDEDEEKEEDLIVHFNSKLKTGTYKLTIELYDDNSYIGEDYEYIFVK